jgi:hypothetical protein
MALPFRAEAYVDPGSGSLIWQALAAAFVGALFYVRRIWTWVGRLLGKRSTEESSEI